MAVLLDGDDARGIAAEPLGEDVLGSEVAQQR
jgi:hypothetical protein